MRRSCIGVLLWLSCVRACRTSVRTPLLKVAFSHQASKRLAGVNLTVDRCLQLLGLARGPLLHIGEGALGNARRLVNVGEDDRVPIKAIGGLLTVVSHPAFRKSCFFVVVVCLLLTLGGRVCLLGIHCFDKLSVAFSRHDGCSFGGTPGQSHFAKPLRAKPCKACAKPLLPQSNFHALPTSFAAQPRGSVLKLNVHPASPFALIELGPTEREHKPYQSNVRKARRSLRAQSLP